MLSPAEQMTELVLPKVIRKSIKISLFKKTHYCYSLSCPDGRYNDAKFHRKAICKKKPWKNHRKRDRTLLYF